MCEVCQSIINSKYKFRYDEEIGFEDVKLDDEELWEKRRVEIEDCRNTAESEEV